MGDRTPTHSKVIQKDLHFVNDNRFDVKLRQNHSNACEHEFSTHTQTQLTRIFENSSE